MTMREWLVLQGCHSHTYTSTLAIMRGWVKYGQGGKSKPVMMNANGIGSSECVQSDSARPCQRSSNCQRMKSPCFHDIVLEPPFNVDAIRQELANILATPAFRNSQLRSRFLSYVVNCTLAGDERSLKEYVIGCEVFSRPTSFDPRLDSVVRVHATLIRKKLQAYYEVNGSNALVRITIPPGSYKPLFQGLSQDINADMSESSAEGLSASDLQALLVLPCADLDAKDESPFSNGLTDELIIALSQLKHVRTVPGLRESSGSIQELIRHASHARATVILSTSFRSTGESIKMTAKLISAITLHVMWTRRFEAEAEDELSCQQALARAVANAVDHQVQD